MGEMAPKRLNLLIAIFYLHGMFIVKTGIFYLYLVALFMK